MPEQQTIHSASPAQWERWYHFAATEGHDHRPATLFSYERLFGGVDLNGKEVLEIGSGKGLTSCYIALKGATRVVSMEPELAGSRSQAIAVQQQRISELGLQNMELLVEDFNSWDPGGHKFDVIVSIASINHLHESPFHALRHRPTYERYAAIASQIKSLLRPGGVAIITDACRYGFFWFAKSWGINPPWATKPTSINWKIHQNPGVWREIFLASGFARVDITYPLPFKLRSFHGVVANPFVNFFLLANFIMKCSRGPN